ncbi:MAG: PT domain-containing protein, partial [Ignavibacteriae bacterium]|nr:PT domain-containing protein [Ignavibacteriota bacterium]
STNQPINQSTNQPINQSTNQPINQSTNQPINQQLASLPRIRIYLCTEHLESGILLL